MRSAVKAEILKGKRVMVVEDDYIQSGDIAQTLISQGADVVVFDDVRSALGFWATTLSIPRSWMSSSEESSSIRSQMSF